jgi:hypothetical protein
VTENKGRNTPGVDKIIWKTPEAKTNAIASLKRRGYTPLPLRSANDSEEEQPKDEAARHPDGGFIMHSSQLNIGMLRLKIGTCQML